MKVRVVKKKYDHPAQIVLKVNKLTKDLNERIIKREEDPDQ